MKTKTLAIIAIPVILLSLVGALASDGEASDSDFNINDLNLTTNVTLREVIETGIGDNFEESGELSDNPLLKLVLPLGVKIIPLTDEPAFILEISETGVSTIDEDQYSETPDLEVAIKIENESGKIDYLKPNTIVGCALASVLHREQDIPLKGTDTLKFKIVDFIVNLIYKLKGSDETAA